MVCAASGQAPLRILCSNFERTPSALIQIGNTSCFGVSLGIRRWICTEQALPYVPQTLYCTLKSRISQMVNIPGVYGSGRLFSHGILWSAVQRSEERVMTCSVPCSCWELIWVQDYVCVNKRWQVFRDAKNSHTLQFPSHYYYELGRIWSRVGLPGKKKCFVSVTVQHIELYLSVSAHCSPSLTTSDNLSQD